MSKGAINSLPWRYLRRLGLQLKEGHRRHRASIATEQEDIRPPQQCPSLDPQSPLVKTYGELPTAAGYPVIGTLLEFLAAGGVEHQHKYVTRRHRELGGVFRENLAGKELVFVSDPAAVREVFAAEGQYPEHFIPEAWLLYNEDRQARRGLFFMEGEEWKKHRSVLNRRLLRPGPLVPHLPALSRVADTLVDRWISHFSDCPVPNLERELYRWSIESLGVLVFGNRIGLLGESPSNTEEQQRQVEMASFIEAIHGIFKETTALGTLPPALARSLNLPAWKRFTSCLDDALASGQALVSARLRASRERKARVEDPQNPPALLDQLLHDDILEEQDILCLLTDLFLAAADTTSHTAIWSLYLLGRHPEAVHRARQEVLEVTGGTGQVEGQHLATLPYLKAVVKEALRMYPAAPFQTRVLQRTANLGGYQIPAGTMVILSVYTTGRDPAIFPNPDSFSPDRWLRDAPPPSSTSTTCPSSRRTADAAPRLHSHAFIPFGVGARSCIGRRVAEMELYFLLAKLVARADLQALNQVDFVLRMVGVASPALQLQVAPRTPATTTTRPSG